MDWTTHYLIDKKTYFWRVNKSPGGNHTFPAELEVEFTDIEPNLSVSSVPSLSHVQLFATPWNGFSVHHQFPELAHTHVHQISDAIQPSHPLSSPSPLAFSLSQHQGLFQWVSSSHHVAEVLELQLQHQSFQWIFLISFRMDWLDLLAVQGTLKSLLQHHSSKASILQRSAFFVVQFSHPYMAPGKITALARRTFVSKIMSLLFNMLYRLVITFLPKTKHPLISWLQSPSAVILEPPKIKSLIVSIVSPSICHEVMGPDAMICVFLNVEFQASFFTLLFHFHQEAL